MKKEVKIFSIIGMIVLFASCSNYKYLSDNDVYSQKPTAINLQEDETDLTSYNAYVARTKGMFDQEYKDPRITYRFVGNGFVPVGGFMPVYNYGGVFYGSGLAYGRGGMFNSYFMNPYSGFHYAYNPYGGYPMYYYGSYYSPFNSPYYNGGFYSNPYGPGYGYPYPYGYNPYYHGGYGGYNSNGGYGYAPVANTTSYYYGKRNSNKGSSKRPTTGSTANQTKSLVTTKTPFNANNQAMGTSRRAAALASSTSKYTYDYSYPKSTTQNERNLYKTGNRTYQSVHRSTSQKTYTPNQSLRSSNKVQVHRTSSGSSATRSNVGRGYGSSSNVRRQGTVQPSTRARGTVSVGGSVRSTSPATRSSSTSSATRTSGSSRRSTSGGR